MSRVARGVLFAQLQDGDLVDGKPIDGMVAGTFIDMYGRRFEFEEEDLPEYAANTQAAIEATKGESGEITGLPIDPGNHEEGDGAAGWITGAFFEEVDGHGVVRFEVRWTEIGVNLVSKKLKAFFSGSIDLLRKVIKGGSLTNWPASRDIETGHILMRPIELAALSSPMFYLEEQESLDERTRQVRNAWYEASETMEGPDSWVTEVFDGHVIVEMGETYYRVDYQEGEDGEIAFAPREDWTEVQHAWIEMALRRARGLFRDLLQLASGEEEDPDNDSDNDSTNSSDPDDPEDEEDVMGVKLAELSVEDQATLVAQLAERMGLTPEAISAAENGNGDLKGSLANLVQAEAQRMVDAQMRESQREQEIAQFTEKVIGGEDDNPRGLPVTDERLAAFLQELASDDLRQEAMAIFTEIHEKGVTPFDERGHQRRLTGEAKLEEWAAQSLQAFLAEDKQATVAEWFELNAPDVGKMEDYDLREFEKVGSREGDE